jgi:hypothetical protein
MVFALACLASPNSGAQELDHNPGRRRPAAGSAGRIPAIVIEGGSARTVMLIDARYGDTPQMSRPGRRPC